MLALSLMEFSLIGRPMALVKEVYQHEFQVCRPQKYRVQYHSDHKGIGY